VNSASSAYADIVHMACSMYINCTSETIFVTVFVVNKSIIVNNNQTIKIRLLNCAVYGCSVFNYKLLTTTVGEECRNNLHIDCLMKNNILPAVTVNVNCKK